MAHEEWTFRAEYFQMVVRNLREKAAATILEAERFEALASKAQDIAVDRGLTELETAIVSAQHR